MTVPAQLVIFSRIRVTVGGDVLIMCISIVRCAMCIVAVAAAVVSKEAVVARINIGGLIVACARRISREGNT